MTSILRGIAMSMLPGGRARLQEEMEIERLEIRLQLVVEPAHAGEMSEAVERLAERPWFMAFDPSHLTGRKRALQVAFDYCVRGLREEFLTDASYAPPYALDHLLKMRTQQWT